MCVSEMRFDHRKVKTIMPAGGRGERLMPFTKDRSKPAVPIAGNFRLIDFPLSNIINAAFETHVHVLVQANPDSLQDHLRLFTNAAIASMGGQSIKVMSPNPLRGFYESDAHSIFEFSLRWEKRHYRKQYDWVLIIMSDQIIRIDPTAVINEAVKSEADMAMVYGLVPVKEARHNLGVLKLNHETNEVIELEEKPAEPYEHEPGLSAGNIAFYAMTSDAFEFLVEKIQTYPKDKSLSKGAIQDMIKNKKVIGYNLADNIIGGKSGNTYFKDVGTVPALVEVNNDLTKRDPKFDLHNVDWPVYTTPRPSLPTKVDSINGEQFVLGDNVIIQHEVFLKKVVINRNSIIGENTRVTNSILFDRVIVGHDCNLDKVVLEKGIEIPDGYTLNPSIELPGIMTLEKYAAIYQKDPNKAPLVPVIADNGYLIIPKGYKFSDKILLGKEI